MEAHIRLILLIVATIVVLGIFLDAYRREKRRGRVVQALPRYARSSHAEATDVEIIPLPPKPNPEYTGVGSRHHSQKANEEQAMHVDESAFDELPAEPSPLKVSVGNELIYITIACHKNEYYDPYRLMQTFVQMGLTYGEDRMYHFKDSIDGKVRSLFTVAQANAEGTFNIHDLDSQICTGLVFYFDPKQFREPHQVFDTLVRAADNVLRTMDGKFHSINQEPWTDALYIAYRHGLRDRAKTGIFS